MQQGVLHDGSGRGFPGLEAAPAGRDAESEGISHGRRHQVGGNPVRDFAFCVSPDPGGDPTLDVLYFLIAVENDSTGQNEDLFLTVSKDGGNSFLPAQPVSTLNGTGLADEDQIGIACEGSKVICAWTDDRNGSDDLFVALSEDCGQTFLPEVQLDGSGPGLGDLDGSICVGIDGPLVVVAWEEEVPGPSGPEEIHLVTSLDGGFTYGTDRLIGEYVPGVDDVDALAVEVVDGAILVAWDDNRTGTDEVYLTTSLDGGASFASDRQLSNDGGGFARITPEPGCIGITWTGGAFPNIVEATLSTNGGESFLAAFPVSDMVQDADFAELAFNAKAGAFVTSWLSDDSGSNELYARGYACGLANVENRSAASNPDSYSASSPILGGSFDATVSLISTGHPLAAIVGFASPLTLPLPGGQVLLVNALDPGGELLALRPAMGPVATFSLPLPPDPSLQGFTAYTQGIHLGGGLPFVLTYAQDVAAGAF